MRVLPAEALARALEELPDAMVDLVIADLAELLAVSKAQHA